MLYATVERKDPHHILTGPGDSGKISFVYCTVHDLPPSYLFLEAQTEIIL